MWSSNAENGDLSGFGKSSETLGTSAKKAKKGRIQSIQ